MTRTQPIGKVQGGASLIVAFRLAGKRVLVVGGGAVAAQRVQRSLEADAEVLVVAPPAHRGAEVAVESGRDRLEAVYLPCRGP